MKSLVLDANIFLFIWFSKSWFTEKLFYLLFNLGYKFYTPVFVYKELLVGVIKLCEKRGLDYLFYKEKIESLLNFVEVVEYEVYNDVIDVVKEEVNQINPKDIDYVALAYKLNCPLWTNDKKLKNLQCIKVFSTEDLLKIYNLTK